MTGPWGTVVAFAVFVVGVLIVVASVEVFVEAVAESALELGVSGFTLAVVLAGTDLENAVLGVAAAVEGLPGMAIGTVFGEALFILCVAVGLAGLLTTFEADTPWRYLLLTLCAPGLLLWLSWDGRLDYVDGVVLTAAYLPLLGVVYWFERRSSDRYFAVEALDGGDELLEIEAIVERTRFAEWWERNEGVANLAVAVVAALGMTAGSEVAVTGARGVLGAVAVTGLAFGATVMSFVASIEEVFLTVEPARRGVPSIGIGNVVGSMLFFVTANAGIIALVAPVDTGGAVLGVHWPFFLGVLLVVVLFLVRGRIGRLGGTGLLLAYLWYWRAALVA